MKHHDARNTEAINAGRHDRQGAALVIAVTMLGIFAILGAAYLQFGFIELDDINYEIRIARTREMAEGGVYAAIGRVHDSLAANQAVNALGNASFTFSAYKDDDNGESPQLVPIDDARGTVEVSVTDESGKININHAPASVLQRVLNVDGATARAITSSLPRTDGAAPEEGRHWLLNLEDLRQRKLVTADQYAGINPSLVTTDTVTDHQQPGAWLSINTAPAEVLAAVLDIPVDQAQALKLNKGPFNAPQALADAAGKPLESLAMGADNAGATFLMQPNCFRILSSAKYHSPTGKDSKAGVEAIVQFDATGAYRIIRWNVLEAAAVEEAPAVVAEAEQQPAEAPAAEAPAESPAEEEKPAEGAPQNTTPEAPAEAAPAPAA